MYSRKPSPAVEELVAMTSLHASATSLPPQHATTRRRLSSTTPVDKRQRLVAVVTQRRRTLCRTVRRDDPFSRRRRRRVVPASTPVISSSSNRCGGRRSVARVVSRSLMETERCRSTWLNAVVHRPAPNESHSASECRTYRTAFCYRPFDAHCPR